LSTPERIEPSGSESSARRWQIPAGILVLLLAGWFLVGWWLIPQAPYASGTDESIRYVAFAAAANRWADESDFHRYGVEHFYYPPLYFLLFAPWYGPEESFLDAYPPGRSVDLAYRARAGWTMISRAWAATVPPPLLALYRASKRVSLVFGLLTLAALAGAMLLVFRGPDRWWLALLGSAPAVFLPQFLYYQTLSNNDSLVNALAAAATLAFVLAIRSASSRHLAGWSLGVAACTGLAILTKLSGLVLLVLVAGCAAGYCLTTRGLAWRRRVAANAAFVAALLLVILVTGGWWLVRNALHGDWTGSADHRLAHPWAFRDTPLGAGWLVEFGFLVSRSWFGQFTGPLVGIPDLAFMAYLLPPVALAVGALFLLPRLAGRLAHGRARFPSSPRCLLWPTLASLAAANLLLVAANDLRTIAPYGRLLFPSLTAVHLLATGVFASRFRRRRRLAALLAVAFYGGIFCWTLVNRIVPAVAQPAEAIRILSSPTTASLPWETWAPPDWRFRLEQPLLIPPGRLRGLRIEVYRPIKSPQVGAALEGYLEVTEGGATRRWPIPRSPLGSNDASGRWTDLVLETPVTLAGSTPGRVVLEATPPIFSLWPGPICLTYVPAGSSPYAGEAVVDGARTGVSFSLAALYD
jgi:hypothetical protein